MEKKYDRFYQVGQTGVGESIVIPIAFVVSKPGQSGGIYCGV
jgi:hypothetical protein